MVSTTRASYQEVGGKTESTGETIRETKKLMSYILSLHTVDSCVCSYELIMVYV
jgi:hypothetical protein